MARKKMELQLIANESARKTTYKKRKKGLIKKVSELSTLCGVSACVIVYGPDEAQPEVWPSHSDAHMILTRFKSLSNMEQNKKMMNQESFLRDRITKLNEQLKKQQKENRRIEVAQLMNQMLARRRLYYMGMEHLYDLTYMVDEKSNAIKERFEELSKADSKSDSSSITPASLPPQPPPMPDDRNGVAVGERTYLDFVMETLKKQP